MTKSTKTLNTINFSYMHIPIANFILTPKEALIAGGSALGGGLLYGGTYVASKMGMGENLDKKDMLKEMAANASAGISSGLGGYLITKALTNKLGT